MRRPLLAFLFIFSLPLMASAATLLLQSGDKIQGDILERTPYYVVVDVQGMPETFYLAEISSIDGKGLPATEEPKPVVSPAAPKVPVPHFGDEQDSLARFMNVRKGGAAAKTSALPSPKPSLEKHGGLPGDMALNMKAPKGNPGSTDKDVNESTVTTPDGDIIVVSAQKIVKYDKNLNVIKEVDLNPPSVSK